MATLKQTEANRRNALKSTGPKTPQGKAAVAMNALRHGLRARAVLLPGENHDEFHQLCDDLEAEWQPQSRTEQFYLEQMAASQWKLARMEGGEAVIRQRPTSIYDQLPLLDRLWQAQSRMERSYARAQRELQRLQNARSQVAQPELEAPAPQPAEDVPAEPEPALPLQSIPRAATSVTPIFPSAEPDLPHRHATLPPSPETLDSGPATMVK